MRWLINYIRQCFCGHDWLVEDGRVCAVDYATDSLMKDQHTRLLVALAKLGASPDEIADSLRKMGIKGQIGINWNCPITHYIKPFYDYETRPNVSNWTVSAVNEPTVTLPNPVALFVQWFDNGTYPDLIEDI